jgi:hypothetical protein
MWEGRQAKPNSKSGHELALGTTLASVWTKARQTSAIPARSVDWIGAKFGGAIVAHSSYASELAIAVRMLV